MSNILEVKNLNAYYNRGKDHILKDVSFAIEEGTICGLVGESGCGKSTLAKTLLGIHKAYTGEIVHLSERPQMVFQDPFNALNPAKRIEWILEEPLRIQGGYTKEQRREKTAQMLQKVDLAPELGLRYPKELSGGQRQRVCIAAALMLSPRLLVADEPVSALDVTIQAQIMELLKNLQREMGLSVLFISHDLRVVYQMCSTVLIMQEGRIVESGEVKDVYFSPRHEYTKRLLEAM